MQLQEDMTRTQQKSQTELHKKRAAAVLLICENGKNIQSVKLGRGRTKKELKHKQEQQEFANNFTWKRCFLLNSLEFRYF